MTEPKKEYKGTQCNHCGKEYYELNEVRKISQDSYNQALKDAIAYLEESGEFIYVVGVDRGKVKRTLVGLRKK